MSIKRYKELLLELGSATRLSHKAKLMEELNEAKKRLASNVLESLASFQGTWVLQKPELIAGGPTSNTRIRRSVAARVREDSGATEISFRLSTSLQMNSPFSRKGGNPVLISSSRIFAFG
jgi:hypothetical protein